MSLTPKTRHKLLAVNGLSAVQKSKNGKYQSKHSGDTSFGESGICGCGVGEGANGGQSSDRPELRLTPTTLRRVVQQRDKLEEENSKLKDENVRLNEELLVHAKCGAKIKELEDKCTECSLSTTTAAEASAAQVGATKALELKVASLTKECEGVCQALDISEAMNQRLRGRAAEMEAMKTILAELTQRAEELEQRALKAEAKPPSTPGPSPADFYADIEMYKSEQLMLCISERVFVHVVAPKTILQVGGKGRGGEQVYKPPCPSDEKVQSFIKAEVQPHFQMVFKTLDKPSNFDAPPRSAVEGQLAPDGSTVRSYAEQFNITLSNFIKKCVLDS